MALPFFPLPLGPSIGRPGLRNTAPLGTGLYEGEDEYVNAFGSQQTPFPMGSGLYGQPPVVNIAPQQMALAQQVPQGGGFDEKFAGLFSNPAFIFGMNLLGSSNSPNPWGPAINNTMASMVQSANAKRQQALADLEAKRFGLEEKGYGLKEQEQALRMQDQALKERQFASEEPLRSAQAEYYKASGQQLGAKTALEQQQADLERQKYERQQSFYDMLRQGFAGTSSAPWQMTPNSLPMTDANVEMGRHGTPAFLLNNLEKTESSGRADAMGPLLKDGTRAMGAYQFTPGTVAMLRNMGYTFNPMDKAQARDAADFYLQYLLQKNGGDYQKAIADYGGFTTKDPSQYINKVMGGGQPPKAPSKSPSLDMMRLGVLGAVQGVPGASQIVELGKAMQPQNVTPGSYQRDADGNLTWIPDTYKEQELAVSRGRLAMEGQKTTNETARTLQGLKDDQAKAARAQADDTRAINSTVQSLDRLAANAAQLMNHPGLARTTGWEGALGFDKIPNSPGKDASGLLESLKSKLVVNTMSSLKSLSANGSTGFGQLSDQENARLETLQDNLDRSQTLEQRKKALADIVKFAEDSKNIFKQHYNSLYGDGSPNVAPSIGPTANVGGAAPSPPMSTDPGGIPASAIDAREYLKSKRQQTTSRGNGKTGGW